MNRMVLRLVACLGLAACAGVVLAGGHRAMPGTVPRVYVEECASCHIAYPPGLLPGAAWQRLMDGLGRHYGTDASLDPASVKLIAGWLRDNAGRGKYALSPPADNRITRTGWFMRKHRGIPDSVWRMPSVKSAANCQACHTGAQQGRFDDDELRIPDGLNAAQRRAFHDGE
ncbi:diheme cytochrome c [Paludibacterium paludis]|uniref:Diheme cytochrome c n=1 Tax=Paludibacterium paludis TaxID=1225769 RepID=A0A918P4R9_9NEIS|nr:diheme cytochrome c [Paludibacterium paludis]GGY19385.1 hypothetical protein GCM10011289_23670 [Paludibacterium paludis]